MTNKTFKIFGAATAGVLACGLLWQQLAGGEPELPPAPVPPEDYDPPPPGVVLNTPAELAIWPWPDAKQQQIHRGVSHWVAKQKDGAVVELFEFDFGSNPNLRFELYDQDQDDAKPFDNVVQFWPRGVGYIVRDLNKQFKSAGKGKVVTAWNGLFFGYYSKSKGQSLLSMGAAHHVSPVVLNKKVYFNTANHRWSFGVQYVNGKPVFKTIHLPSRKVLESEFDFGGGSAQCLIKDGKPLPLRPFPAPGSLVPKQPVPSTPQEAGHIPDFDHMKSSRVTMGWSKDNRHFYLLFVKETDSEGQSIANLRNGKPMGDGWMLSDVQNFWLALGKTRDVWGVANSDAGDAAQLVHLRPDGKYDLVPPRNAHPDMRLTFGPDFKGAPMGGTLMTFYVRDSKG